MKKFSELDVNQIREAIARLPEADGVVIEGEGLMPEADVLLCTLTGRRFNVKVDLDYGAETQAVGAITKDELEELERRIVTIAIGPCGGAENDAVCR